MWSWVNSYFIKREKNIVKEVLEWIDCAHLPVYIVYPRNLQKKNETNNKAHKLYSCSIVG